MKNSGFTRTLKEFSVTPKGGGFTLIEIIIYIGLFSIVVGGGMIATYGILEGSDAGENHITIDEEANFLLRKINWAFSGATSFTTASLPSSLTITGTGTTDLKFDLNGTDMRLTRGTGTSTTLNSSSVKVSGLNFTPLSGDGVTTSFTLTTNQNGRDASQAFSITKYLRK